MMDHNQSTIRTYMAIMAERDAAIQERNMSLEERKKAFAERDMAMLQRDAAISERNSAIQERNEAIAAIQLLDSSWNENTTNQDHERIQHQLNQIMSEVAYSPRGNLTSETDNYHFEADAFETAKPKLRHAKKSTRTKSAKSSSVAKGKAKELTQPENPYTLTGMDNSDDTSDDEQSRSNQIIFDETVMPTPVCTCTGLPQPCYRWGSGGWQSACCTTAISMYPLPQVSNKRNTQVSGRKMSGSAFSKLLNHVASEGYDLSNPLDLKDHWGKRGTNHYTTARNHEYP